MRKNNGAGNDPRVHVQLYLKTKQIPFRRDSTHEEFQICFV